MELNPLPSPTGKNGWRRPVLHCNFSLYTSILAVVVGCFPETSAQMVWEQTSPYPTHCALHGAVYGSNLYVAVGDANTVIASIDGRSWVQCMGPGQALSFFSVAYGIDTFVAVGNFGMIASSKDGLTWTKHSTPTVQHLFAVTYGNGMFVAVGDNGTILTSSDGANWAWRQGVSEPLASVAFGDGKFVAVGGRTRPVVAISTNGFSWTQMSLKGNRQLDEVAYGAGQFVAVGDYEIQTSADGVNWSLQTFTTSQPLRTLTFGKGIFVAGGLSGGVFVSTDGQQWALRTNLSASPIDLTYGAKGFVMVGGIGTLFFSPDGVIWNNQFAGCAGDLSSVAFGAGKFVAADVNQTLMTSTDGITWAAQAAGSGVGNRVRFVNGQFYVVGNGLASSPDATSWQSVEVWIANPILSDITYGNGQYLVSGYSAVYPPMGPPILFPVLSVSTNGQNWQLLSQVPDPLPVTLTFGNGRFVGLSSKDGAAQLMSSTNGLNWTRLAWTSVANLSDVIFASGMFVAVGPGGTILISTNGTDWAEATKTTFFSADFNSVTYAEGQFVAVGSTFFDGLAFAAVSTDGLIWMPTTVPNVSGLSSVAGGNGVKIAVGASGVVLRSPVTTRPLRLGGWQHQGAFVLELEGTFRHYYTVHTSDDLVTWSVWTNVVGQSRVQWIKDADPAPRPQRFYRATE